MITPSLFPQQSPVRGCSAGHAPKQSGSPSKTVATRYSTLSAINLLPYFYLLATARRSARGAQRRRRRRARRACPWRPPARSPGPRARCPRPRPPRRAPCPACPAARARLAFLSAAAHAGEGAHRFITCLLKVSTIKTALGAPQRSSSRGLPPPRQLIPVHSFTSRRHG